MYVVLQGLSPPFASARRLQQFSIESLESELGTIIKIRIPMSLLSVTLEYTLMDRAYDKSPKTTMAIFRLFLFRFLVDILFQYDNKMFVGRNDFVLNLWQETPGRKRARPAVINMILLSVNPNLI